MTCSYNYSPVTNPFVLNSAVSPLLRKFGIHTSNGNGYCLVFATSVLSSEVTNS
jgi:hypothetical protein